jgi:hypothetical protein
VKALKSEELKRGDDSANKITEVYCTFASKHYFELQEMIKKLRFVINIFLSRLGILVGI